MEIHEQFAGKVVGIWRQLQHVATLRARAPICDPGTGILSAAERRAYRAYSQATQKLRAQCAALAEEV